MTTAERILLAAAATALVAATIASNAEASVCSPRDPAAELARGNREGFHE
jgi:hypothetical protein